MGHHRQQFFFMVGSLAQRAAG